MRKAQAVILAAGLFMFGALLWKMNAAEVFRLVLLVGWGFLLIIVQEIAAHLFNAYGWKLSFRTRHAAVHPFGRLVLYRIIGDGVNYLTPSAQIAGEFARTALLDSKQPVEIRASGVVVAKFAQGFAQFLFVVFGIALFVHGRIPMLAPYESLVRAAAGVFAALLLGFIAYEKFLGAEPVSLPADHGSGLWSVPRRFQLFLKDHPGRFSLSILAFLLGYAWGAFEVFWICRFLGLHVGIETALLIEVLSCMIDGLLFMVPAKVGTQEAGKTAIFILLGLPAQTGLAFGIVRHIRELVWAAGGLALYFLAIKGGAGGLKAPYFFPKSGTSVPQALTAPSVSTE